MISDDVYLALCVYEEAQGEPDDGKAAVAQVVLNRARLHYACPDGTITGAVLYPNQFSWAWFDMVDGHYTRVCHTEAEARARSEVLLERAHTHQSTWIRCANVAASVRAGLYVGSDFARITADTVLYYNPDVVPTPPAWADPAKQVGRIGHHVFFHR